MSISRSLWSWLTKEGQENDSSVAISTLHQPPNILPNLSVQSSTATFAQLTWAELIQASEKLAAHFYDQGVRWGDRVMALVGNSLEWALLLFTTYRIGACFVPTPSKYVNRGYVLRTLIEDLKPKVIAVEDENVATSLSELISTPSRIDLGESCVQLITQKPSSSPSPGWSYLTNVKSSGNLSTPEPDLDPSDLAYVQFTSGTTDMSKGCMLSFQNLNAEIHGYHSFYRSQWDKCSTYVSTSMVAGAVGYLGPMNCWTAGGHVILSSRSFDPAITMRAICQHEATHLMLMPTFAKSLLEETISQGHQPRTLKFVNISGDYISSQSLEQIKSALQIDRLVFSWGMSEGAPVFGWPNHEEIPVSNATNVPSVGRPLPGSEAKIVSIQADETDTSEFDDAGELHVSSDAIISRYLGGRHASNFYIDEKGTNWFKTGDIAQLDDTGAVFIQGRLKDEIKSNGVRVIPSIIECFIMEKFQLEAVVIGVPHEILGEAVVGILKPNGSEITVNARDSINIGLEKRYAPAYKLQECVSLQELGLDDWPLGST